MDEIRVLSVALLYPRLPTKSGLPPLPLLPPHWFSTKCSHDSQFYSQRLPYLQQIHTQALAENRTHLKVSSHTPTPLVLHPQTLPFCNIQLTSSIQNLIISPIICTAHSHGSKTMIFWSLCGYEPGLQRWKLG